MTGKRSEARLLILNEIIDRVKDCDAQELILLASVFETVTRNDDKAEYPEPEFATV